MTKTTKEILDIEEDIKRKKGMFSKEYQEFIVKKWYSDDEVDKIIEDMVEIHKEMEQFKKTGIPRCPNPKCKKNFKQIDKYTWKPDCEHLNNHLRLSIG